ncbi:MAG: GNAT family N-acetyltransferase [Caulobacterales bacterium]
MIDLARVAYRDATIGDAQALYELSLETFTATFAALYPVADLKHYIANTFGRDLQEAELADNSMHHRLACHGEELIGFARLGAFKLPIAQDGKNALELHKLYLRDAAKGLGVAHELMRWTMEEARRQGADAMYLGVYQGNDRAQRFYARFGFEIVGEYEFPVGQTRDPEYIMRAAL